MPAGELVLIANSPAGDLYSLHSALLTFRQHIFIIK